jgi:hypothetical protein
MRKLKTILEEALNLDNTQKAVIAYISTAPTPKMAYGVVTGARNAVAARLGLELSRYIIVDHKNKEVVLTPEGEQILTSENLVDDAGELTDRGQELIDNYIREVGEWVKFEGFESFKYSA